VQSSLKATLTQNFFLSGTTFSKEGKKEIRTPEDPAASRNPERCQAPIRTALTPSKRSDGGAHEGSRQWPPPEITIVDTPDQATSGADETTSRPPPLQVSFSPSSFPLRLSESFYIWGEKFGTGSSRSHRRLGGDQDRSSGRKSEGTEREIGQKNLKEESEHSRNGPPYKPNSERALGQRIRKNLPPGGRYPRSIASGLQHRA